MGVDFYSCSRCGETFPDCGDYVRCDCWMKWCSDECAEKDGFVPDDEELSIECSCKFCREEELLKHCLQRLGISREEAVVDYFGRG